MSWGILLATAKPDTVTDSEVMASTIQNARSAERWGFDSAWILEHHFTPYALNPDTFGLAGYLLGATETLKVGTAVTIAPFMHPVRLAESTALLDQLSQGRFLLGLGRGICPEDFEVFGIDATKSHELLHESVDILLDAWTKPEVRGDGPNYPFRPVSVTPRPYTNPRPSIHVAAESPSSVEWAAKHGFPLLMQLVGNYEELGSRVEFYNEIAESAGHRPESIEHVLVCLGHVAESREEAKKHLIENMEWWGEQSEKIGFNVEQLKKLPSYRYHLNRIQQWVLQGEDTRSCIEYWLDHCPLGTPDQCVSCLEDIIAATGVHHVVIGLEGAAQQAVTERNIEVFGRDILPKVSNRRRSSAA